MNQKVNDSSVHRPQDSDRPRPRPRRAGDSHPEGDGGDAQGGRRRLHHDHHNDDDDDHAETSATSNEVINECYTEIVEVEESIMFNISDMR